MVASSNESDKAEKLAKDLVKAKKQGIDKKEIARLQLELEKLDNQQQEWENKLIKNDKVLIWNIGVFSAFALILGGVILIVKRKKIVKKNYKIKKK